MTIYEHISKIVRPNMVFVEIGSNAGDTAQIINQMILEQTKFYRYIAFEPDARFWPNMKRLATRYPKVEFHKEAISDKEGEASLFVSSGNNTLPNGSYQAFDNSSSIKKPTPLIFEYWPGMKFDEVQPVKTVSLDSYNLGCVDFIWVDIQGAELDFIRGAQKTLANTRYMYTEYNGQDTQENEIYEGCPGLLEILGALPNWSVVEDYSGDILLRNSLLEYK